MIVKTTYGGLRFMDGRLQQLIYTSSEKESKSEWCYVPTFATKACYCCNKEYVCEEDPTYFGFMRYYCSEECKKKHSL